MKKTLIAVSALAAAFLSQPAVADAGSNCHFHGSKPAAESTVTSCAVTRKEALIKAGKLDAAWQPIKPAKVEAVEGKKGKEWKVTFKDPAAKDKTKETLYMFFTLPGNFIAANFTGQ